MNPTTYPPSRDEDPGTIADLNGCLLYLLVTTHGHGELLHVITLL